MANSPLLIVTRVALPAILASSAAAQLGATYCHSAANSSGATAALTATGSTDVSANDVTLHGSSLPPGALTLPISSRERSFLPGYVGTAHTLCLGGAIGRHVGLVTMADPSGVVTVPIDTQQVPHPAQQWALVPGDTLNFQLWYRDVQPGTGSLSGLSDGLSITFCAEPPFAGERIYGSYYFSFHSAFDLDGDGRNDIVGGTHSALEVRYGLAGGGHGPYQSHSMSLPWGVHGYPTKHFPGDLDGNGLLDCVVLNAGPGAQSPALGVLLQIAPRQFQGNFWSSPYNHQEVTAGDFDGDGAIDLAITTSGESALHIWTGDGTGAFTAGQLITAPSIGYRFTATRALDLDGNGRAELYAASTYYGLAVYEWTGPPGLVLTTTRVFNGPDTILPIDVDGDGDVDLVSPSWQYVSVLRNLGNGMLTMNQERYPVPFSTQFQGHEDVDGDGDTDLVFFHYIQQLHVLWNSGSGVFYPTVAVDLGVFHPHTYLQDADGDGRFDALEIGNTPNWVDIRLRTGMFEIEPRPAAVALALATTPRAVIDLDGDGHEELVASGGGTLDVVHYAAGWAQPTVTSSASTTPLETIALGDIDGDGDFDVVELNVQPGGTTLVLHTQGALHQFTPAAVFPVPVDFERHFVTDFNADGLADVVLASQSQSRFGFFRNSSNGQLQLHSIVVVPPFSHGSIVFRDVTGDGWDDVVYNQGPVYWVLAGLAGGSLATAMRLAVHPSSPHTATFEDLDGDGDLDFIAWQSTSWELFVQMRVGPNAFAPPRFLPLGSAGVRGVRAFDWERDGDVDLAVARSVGLLVLSNHGDGEFAPARHFVSAPNGIQRMIPGDLDRDGDEDLLLSPSSTAWFALENRCR